MVLEVFNCGCLACRIGKPGLDELAEHLVINAVEAHVVKYPVKDKIRAVNGDVGDVRQELLNTQALFLAFQALFSEQVRRGWRRFCSRSIHS